MSKRSARKNRYYNLYKKDFPDTNEGKDDIFIDIRTGKASVRKCRED